MTNLFVLAAGLLGAPTAHAATGLEWKLGDAPVSYLLDAQVMLPEILYVRTEQNVDRRTTEIRLVVVTTCSVAATRGKKAWELSCALDDVALYGAPVRGEGGQLLPVLEEWDERLTGKSVTLQFTRDGQLKNVGLDPVYPSRNRRTTGITETMRLLLSRAFSTMDLQLPKGGDDGGERWRQRESAALGFVDSNGTLGSAAIWHKVTEVAGDVVTIQTDAEGTIGPAEMMPAGNTERPANLYETEFRSLAQFDTASGRMVLRRFQSQGRPTPSSRSAEGGPGFRYLQEATLSLIEDEVPKLGGNREVPSLELSTFERGVVNP